MPRSTRLLVLAMLVAAGASPAVAGPRPAGWMVAPGYDMFVTPDGGARVDVDTAVAGVPVMTFRGRPIGTFDFGARGRHRVGATDTIVRRLDTATPASPRVRVELVGLLLESTNVAGYFVTLQSARPLGLPSTGTLDFQFDRSGVGGLLRSELLVNYDIRHGSPTGPIVATGSTGMGFVAENVVWLHEPLSGRSSDRDTTHCVEVLGGKIYCLTAEGAFLCHEAGPPAPVNHLHCIRVGDRVPSITGVNYRLNGRDTSADFQPIGTGELRSG